MERKRASGLPDFKQGVPLMSHSQRQIPLAYSLLSAGHAAEIADGYALLDINELLTGGREGCLALVITGESMKEDIYPGHIVVIDPHREPKNGDAVAVSINNETCVKLFERYEQRLYLVPKNPEFPIREVRPSDNLHILGVVLSHFAVY